MKHLYKYNKTMMNEEEFIHFMSDEINDCVYDGFNIITIKCKVICGNFVAFVTTRMSILNYIIEIFK